MFCRKKSQDYACTPYAVASHQLRMECRKLQPTSAGIKETHMVVEGYCVKCKAKRNMVSPEQVTMKNGKPATKGICPECGTKMFKIGSSK